METQTQHQAMFGCLGSEGPTGVGMTFARPFYAAHHKWADQTRKNNADQLGNRRKGARYARVGKTTRAENIIEPNNCSPD